MEATALQRLQKESHELAQLVTSTLGPRGKSIMISRPSVGEMARLTKDGATITKFFTPELPGALLLREAAERAEKKTGDGTTTAVLLADHLIQQKPLNFQQTEALQRAASNAISLLRATKQKKFDLVNVAKTALNNDLESAKLVAEAFTRVPSGAIQLRDGMEDRLDVISGARFESGWLSPFFASGRPRAILERPLVFCADGVLESAEEVVVALETAAQQKRPLVIAAGDVKDQALAVLVANHLNKIVQCVAVRVPGYGNVKTANVEDIAAMCQARPVKIKNQQYAALGECERFECDDRQFFLNFQDSEQLKELRHLVALELKSKTRSEFEQLETVERLARLRGRIAELTIGGESEAAQRERRDRFEDAVGACRTALSGGVVPGGGAAWIRVAELLEKDNSGSQVDQEMRKLLAETLKQPLKTICGNSDISGRYVIEKLSGMPAGSVYDVTSGIFGDCEQLGVLDPAEVSTESLSAAVDIACQILRVGGDIREPNELEKTRGN